MLRVTVLGCGTSTGVPVIGCDCPVCGSGDPRNERLRPSLWIEAEDGRSVLVDTSTDLRLQALRHRVDRVDAVVFTHAHADHILGLDEIRIYNFYRKAAGQEMAIPCYGSAETLGRIRQAFSYIFEDGQEGGGKPKITLHPVDGPFEAAGIRFEPVRLWHGELEVYGYRIGDFAYLTDCNRIPEESFAQLDGLDVLILDALRERPHPTHFTIAEALDAASRIGARRTLLTHMNHEVDARTVDLPEGVELSRDGLVLEVA